MFLTSEYKNSSIDLLLQGILNPIVKLTIVIWYLGLNRMLKFNIFI